MTTRMKEAEEGRGDKGDRFMENKEAEQKREGKF